MGRKRYKDQILRRILETCTLGAGASKTQIVYSCGLNFNTVVPYLDMVTRNGLAEAVEGTVVRYRMTAKGEEALRCMRELEELMGERVAEEEMKDERCVG